MAKANQFIQDIQFNNREVDLGHLLESSYIERTDIVSPLLILRFNDVDAIIREEYGIKKSDNLTVSFGDPLGRDAVHENEEFTILSMPLVNNVLTINMVQKDALRLMQLSHKARFFVKESPLSVVKKLINSSSLQFVSSINTTVEDYHLLPQTRPAKLIRQIARESGSFAFINRGIVRLDTFETLRASANVFEYHHRDSREDNQIIDYRKLDGGWKKDNIVGRNHALFDMTKGIVRSVNHTNSATEWMGVGSKSTLDAMDKVAVPAIEFLVEGHGGLKPGEICRIKWNKLQTESPIDESLPDEVMIGAVTHYSRANRYQCKVMGLAET